MRVAAAFGELRFTSLLDRALALRGAGGAAAQPASLRRDAGGRAPTRRAPRVAAAAHRLAASCGIRPCVAGERTARRACASGSSAADAWLGVAIDDGAGASLFGDHRDLAVAGRDEVALRDPRGRGRRCSPSCCAAAASPPATRRRCCRRSARRTRRARATRRSTPWTRRASSTSRSRPTCSSRTARPTSSRRLHADYLGEPLPDADDDDAARGHPRAGGSAISPPSSSAASKPTARSTCCATIEMPLVPVLVRMERVGVGLDTSVLAGLSAEAASSIDALRAEIHALAGCEFTHRLAQAARRGALREAGPAAAARSTKTGFSTDASVLATLAPIHPIAEKIVEYRELTKLKSTYLDALPRMLGEDGRLHTSFNQTVAATGRLSSSNPNLQNIPVRTEYGRRIRAAFVPARAGRPDGLGGLQPDRAAHPRAPLAATRASSRRSRAAWTSTRPRRRASSASSRSQVEPGMRARAKAVNFGIVYGQSAHGLADSLKIAHAEAQAMIDRYYAAYPRVRAYLDETVAEAHRDGFAMTLFGRKRRIPELAAATSTCARSASARR